MLEHEAERDLKVVSPSVLACQYALAKDQLLLGAKLLSLYFAFNRSSIIPIEAEVPAETIESSALVSSVHTGN